MKLEGVDNDEDARLFTNLSVFFPKSYLKDNKDEFQAPGDYFIGFTIVEELEGELGKIIGVDDSTVNVLFEVDYSGQELLVPANDDFILSIDEENRFIHMRLPQGLLSL